MKVIETLALTTFQKKGIIRLWNQEYPEKLKLNGVYDLEDYFKNLDAQKHYLLINKKNELEGWFFLFRREGESWFAMILAKSIQGKGYGTQLLNRAKETATVLNGWAIDHYNDKKANGETYLSPLAFYLRNDFKILKEERLALENISAVKIVWAII